MTQSTIATDQAVHAWVQDHLEHGVQQEMDAEQMSAYVKRIKQLLIEKNAVLVAHYYTDPIIQALADETGGCVADSLEMARFGRDHSAQTLVVAGVKFMGETAKILSRPGQKIKNSCFGALRPPFSAIYSGRWT